MLYVPAGFAHGFQTLEDDTHATYQVSYPYTPGAEGGVRWDDPAFGVALAAAGQRDLGQGRGLAAARGLSPRRRRGSARSHVGTAAKTLNRLSFQHLQEAARPGRSAAQLVAEMVAEAQRELGDGVGRIDVARPRRTRSSRRCRGCRSRAPGSRGRPRPGADRRPSGWCPCDATSRRGRCRRSGPARPGPRRAASRRPASGRCPPRRCGGRAPASRAASCGSPSRSAASRARSGAGRSRRARPRAAPGCRGSSPARRCVTTCAQSAPSSPRSADPVEHAAAVAGQRPAVDRLDQPVAERQRRIRRLRASSRARLVLGGVW